MNGANGFADSDIDVFIFGLTPELATAKMHSLLLQLQRASGRVVDNPQRTTARTHHMEDMMLSEHAVTLLGLSKFPRVQVVLRCYASPAEILCGFDIDCCCVGYDGRDVYILPRACVGGDNQSATHSPRASTRSTP